MHKSGDSNLDPSLELEPPLPKPQTTRLRAMLASLSIVLVGVLLLLGNLNILRRAGGDIRTRLPVHKDTVMLPAGVLMAIVTLFGFAVLAFGIAATIIGWRATRKKQLDSPEDEPYADEQGN